MLLLSRGARRTTHKIALGEGEQPDDAQATEHAENVDGVPALQAGDAEDEGDPEGDDGDEVQAVETVAEERPAREMEALLLLERAVGVHPVHHGEGPGKGGRHELRFLRRLLDRSLALGLEDGPVLLGDSLPDAPLAPGRRVVLGVDDEAGHDDPGNDLEGKHDEQGQDGPVDPGAGPAAGPGIPRDEDVGGGLDGQEHRLGDDQDQDEGLRPRIDQDIAEPLPQRVVWREDAEGVPPQGVRKRGAPAGREGALGLKVAGARSLLGGRLEDLRRVRGIDEHGRGHVARPAAVGAGRARPLPVDEVALPADVDDALGHGPHDGARPVQRLARRRGPGAAAVGGREMVAIAAVAVGGQARFQVEAARRGAPGAGGGVAEIRHGLEAVPGRCLAVGGVQAADGLGRGLERHPVGLERIRVGALVIIGVGRDPVGIAGRGHVLLAVGGRRLRRAQVGRQGRLQGHAVDGRSVAAGAAGAAGAVGGRIRVLPVGREAGEVGRHGNRRRCLAGPAVRRGRHGAGSSGRITFLLGRPLEVLEGYGLLGRRLWCRRRAAGGLRCPGVLVHGAGPEGLGAPAAARFRTQRSAARSALTRWRRVLAKP